MAIGRNFMHRCTGAPSLRSKGGSNKTAAKLPPLNWWKRPLAPSHRAWQACIRAQLQSCRSHPM